VSSLPAGTQSVLKGYSKGYSKGHSRNATGTQGVLNGTQTGTQEALKALKGYSRARGNGRGLVPVGAALRVPANVSRRRRLVLRPRRLLRLLPERLEVDRVVVRRALDLHVLVLHPERKQRVLLRDEPLEDHPLVFGDRAPLQHVLSALVLPV
jgi:hypothetical protein